jgi:hypothetical protein
VKISFYDKPCAAKDLLSYRYENGLDFIMIGAKNDADALNEAGRSLCFGEKPIINKLERYNYKLKKYESI